MIISNKEKGDLGEGFAIEYLKKKNIKILDKNFRIRTGEIDIIGVDKNILVFYEVKTRTNYHFGLPCEAVNLAKKKNIKKLAEFYILKNNYFQYDIRFDVVEIYLDKNAKFKKIEWIKNAF
ncbi:MAG: YraN family protein [Clostridiaceae bacterium]